MADDTLFYSTDEEDDDADVDIPWDTIDEVVLRGAPLLKWGRSGDPHFRHFNVSHDCRFLTWYSNRKTTADSRVELTRCELFEGQATDMFKRQPRSDLADVSFSLICDDGKRGGVAIACKDSTEYKTWVCALRYLIQGPPPAALLDAHRRIQNWSARGAAGAESAVSLPQRSSNISRDLKKRMKDSNDVFAFGRGAWGKLGLGDEAARIEPTIIPLLLGKAIRVVACGVAHTLVLADSGEVYAFGHGGNGRLGTGSTDAALVPRLLVKPEHNSGGAATAASQSRAPGSTTAPSSREPYIFRSIACGALHSLACDAGGVAYSWGCGYHGATGHCGAACSDDVLFPTPVACFAMVEVVEVGEGTTRYGAPAESLPGGASAAAAPSGAIGAHLHSHGAPPQLPHVVSISFLRPRVTSVAAGGEYSAFLDESRRLFTCGLGDAPLGHSRRVLARGLGVRGSAVDASGPGSWSPAVASHSSGGASLPRTEAPSPDPWGQHGAVGRQRLTPDIVLGSARRSRHDSSAAAAAEPAMPSMPARVAAAEGLRAFVGDPSSRGNHHQQQQQQAPGAWGNGVRDLRVPTRVVVSEDGTFSTEAVTTVSCGEMHMGAVTASGHLYTWGFNGSGALGQGDTRTRALPCRVRHLPRDVVSVACGAAHTLALVASRPDGDRCHVYAWGCTKTGQVPRLSAAPSAPQSSQLSRVAPLLPAELGAAQPEDPRTTGAVGVRSSTALRGAPPRSESPVSSSLRGSSTSLGLGAASASTRPLLPQDSFAFDAAPLPGGGPTHPDPSSVAQQPPTNPTAQVPPGPPSSPPVNAAVCLIPRLVSFPVGAGGGGGSGSPLRPQNKQPAAASANGGRIRSPSDGSSAIPGPLSGGAASKQPQQQPPQRGSSPQRPQPSSIAAGAFHSAVLFDDGSLFVFGDGAAGQLGISKGAGLTEALKAVQRAASAAASSLAAGSSAMGGPSGLHSSIGRFVSLKSFVSGGGGGGVSSSSGAGAPSGPAEVFSGRSALSEGFKRIRSFGAARYSSTAPASGAPVGFAPVLEHHSEEGEEDAGGNYGLDGASWDILPQASVASHSRQRRFTSQMSQQHPALDPSSEAGQVPPSPVSTSGYHASSSSSASSSVARQSSSSAGAASSAAAAAVLGDDAIGAGGARGRRHRSGSNSSGGGSIADDATTVFSGEEEASLFGGSDAAPDYGPGHHPRGPTPSTAATTPPLSVLDAGDRAAPMLQEGYSIVPAAAAGAGGGGGGPGFGDNGRGGRGGLGADDLRPRSVSMACYWNNEAEAGAAGDRRRQQHRPIGLGGSGVVAMARNPPPSSQQAPTQRRQSMAAPWHSQRALLPRSDSREGMFGAPGSRASTQGPGPMDEDDPFAGVDEDDAALAFTPEGGLGKEGSNSDLLRRPPGDTDLGAVDSAAAEEAADAIGSLLLEEYEEGEESEGEQGPGAAFSLSGRAGLFAVHATGAAEAPAAALGRFQAAAVGSPPPPRRATFAASASSRALPSGRSLVGAALSSHPSNRFSINASLARDLDIQRPPSPTRVAEYNNAMKAQQRAVLQGGGSSSGSIAGGSGGFFPSPTAGGGGGGDSSPSGASSPHSVGPPVLQRLLSRRDSRRDRVSGQLSRLQPVPLSGQQGEDGGTSGAVAAGAEAPGSSPALPSSASSVGSTGASAAPSAPVSGPPQPRKMTRSMSIWGGGGEDDGGSGPSAQDVTEELHHSAAPGALDVSNWANRSNDGLLRRALRASQAAMRFRRPGAAGGGGGNAPLWVGGDFETGGRPSAPSGRLPLSGTASSRPLGFLERRPDEDDGLPLPSTLQHGPLPVVSLAQARRECRSVACGLGYTVVTVATEWMRDGDAPACMRCHAPFQVALGRRLRHHCRNCGGIFCNSCSSSRTPLLRLGHIEPVRVCDACFSRLSHE